MNVFEAIEQGLHDEELDQLIAACRKRGQAIPLGIGDLVEATEQCSPKYMQGVKGKIVSLTGKQKYGGAVYLVEILPEEEWKVAGTKMSHRDPTSGKMVVGKIQMPRSLIKKVTVD